MKKTKKLVSIILVILLVTLQLSPFINVKAITLKGENSEGIREDLIIDTANLIVNNVSNGDTLMAYKVLDTFYNSATNEITYEFTSEFNTFLNTDSIKAEYPNFSIEDYIGLTSDNEDGSASTLVITASTLNVLVSKYATYIRNNNITGIEMTTTDDTASANVVAGSYLILPKTVTTIGQYDPDLKSLTYLRNLYGVMIGNVVYSADETGWVLNDCSIYGKYDLLINGTILSIFSTSEYFDNVNSGNSDALIDSFTQNINTVLQKKHMYGVSISLPSFPTNAINKIAGAEIEFPEGVTYDTNNIYLVSDTFIKVTDGKIIDESGVEIGKLTLNGQHVTIELNTSVDSSSIDSIVDIAFDVELNDNAVVGPLGNEITSIITLTDDPYVEGSTTSITTSDIMTTYGLELTSYGEKDTDGNAPLLKGATYEVYTDSQLTEQSKLGEFTVGEDGTGRFTGVPSGVVYLKQTKAPTGYQLITDTIEVHIADETSTDTNNDSYYEVSTYNKAMWYLPLTGGSGTIIYTLVGMLIIVFATFGIFYYRKRNVGFNN